MSVTASAEGPKVRQRTVAADAQQGDGDDGLQGANRGVEVHHLVDMCSNTRCATVI